MAGRTGFGGTCFSFWVRVRRVGRGGGWGMGGGGVPCRAEPISGAHVYLLASASGASGAGAAAYGGAGIAASASNASVSLLNTAGTGHSDSLGAYVLTRSEERR